MDDRAPIMQDDGTALIPLTNGKFAIIDADDIPLILGWKWHAHRESGLWYAGRFQRKTRPHNIRMHRVIIGASSGQIVDHINRNGLDNRRCNLRIATISQNKQNVSKYGIRSQFRGVSPSHSRWRAQIRVNGKLINLGSYDSEPEAAIAYDVASLQYYGEHGYRNFPEDATHER